MNPLTILARRLRLMVARAVVKLAAEGESFQVLQVSLLAGEVADNVERLGEYGFTGSPEPGAEAIALALGGSRRNLVVVACDDRRYRPTDLAPGESCQYTRFGHRVWLKADGSIEVTPANGQAVKVAGDLEVTGNVVATGDVTAAGDVADGTGTLAAARLVYNGHVHPEQNGSPGPNTLPPQPLMT